MRGISIALMFGVLFCAVPSWGGPYSEAVKDLGPQVYLRLSQPADPQPISGDRVDNEMGNASLDAYWGWWLVPGGYPMTVPLAGVAGPRPTDTIGGGDLVGLEMDNLAVEFRARRTDPPGGGDKSDLIMWDSTVNDDLDSSDTTYAFFFKTVQNVSSIRMIVTASAYTYRFTILLNMGKLVLVNNGTDVTALDTGTVTYNDGQWHHAVAVRNGNLAANMRLYVDGAQVTLVSPSAWAAITSTYTRLGANSTANNTYPYDGFMDEFAIWTRALSEQEALDLFDAAQTPPLITVSKGACYLAEAGPTSDTYEIVCTQAPDPNVTVLVTPTADTGLATDVKLSGGSQNGDWGEAITLFFDTSDWDEPQTVTVTAADDNRWNLYGNYDREATHSVIIVQTASSPDEEFDGYDIDNVRIDISDDEVPYLILTES